MNTMEKINIQPADKILNLEKYIFVELDEQKQEARARGVDLIDLLIQARKPETQLEAANKIKQTVNSVETGLYEILTSAEYTIDDFQDCLEIIKQAIANHAHDQHALSA